MRYLALTLLILGPVGAQGTSFSQTSVPTKSRRGAPQVIVPGQQLWLRADQGVEKNFSNLVQEWRDQSGNGNHLTQQVASTRPLFVEHGIDGNHALRFDGNDSLVRPSGMPLGSYTKFVMFTLDDLDRANSLLSGDSGHSLLFAFSERARAVHPASVIVSDTPVLAHTSTLISVTFDAFSGQAQIFQDGALVAAGALASQDDPSLRIGSLGNGGFLIGSVSEVQVYDRALAPHARQLVEQQILSRHIPSAAPDVQFDQVPLNGQIFQRDGLDQAQVNITGEVELSDATDIEVELYARSALQSTVTQPLSYASGPAPFALAVPLTAGLIDYDIEVWIVTPTDRIRVARRQNLACGDLLVISGQSNAAARDFHDEGLGNLNQSPWIRSYGTANCDPIREPTDLHWDLADAETSTDHASAGQWAVHLGQLLEAELQVPIGLLNGANEGTNIAANLRNDVDPTDLTTIYGRLLNRGIRAGFAEHARALIWFQGEADGNPTSAAAYPDHFETLHDSWLLDYPAIEQIYVFQVRAGCGNDLVDDGIRSVLRELPETYPLVKLMSTTAVPTHDGCHFFHTGYEELGARISRLILRDLHGSLDTQEIAPPNIELAQWATANQDMLLLQFEDPDDVLVVEAGAESDFRLDDGTGVSSATVNGNTILLTLAAPSTATTISYVGHPFDGPFLRNSRGVGALTFFQFPIAP